VSSKTEEETISAISNPTRTKLPDVCAEDNERNMVYGSLGKGKVLVIGVLSCIIVAKIHLCLTKTHSTNYLDGFVSQSP